MATRTSISEADMLARAKSRRQRGPVTVSARTPREAAELLKARFDAAETNSNNTRHWRGADGLSADAAGSAFVRKILRERARYEVANNSYAKGMLLTLAQDTVGTGPRLQLLPGEDERSLPESRRAALVKMRRAVEIAFAHWARRVRLGAKLRTMRMAKAEDGEAFAVMFTNPGHGHRIPLDFELIEADQVTTPDQGVLHDPLAIDGIRFDRFGNPAEYHLLREHPGSDRYYHGWNEYDRYSAQLVIHYFRQDRPGQSRGIPEIAPALPVYNQLRRYTLAVLTAAEKAASIAGVIESELPPSSEESVTPFESIDLDPAEWWTMPQGWKANAFKSEQPTTTYPAGKWEFISEAARCIEMPINIAMGNSSKHNYASGRLDHQMYHRAIWLEREEIEQVVLSRLLRAWFDEGALIEDYFPPEMRELMDELPPHRWFWDGFAHSDPNKEATAQTTRLANNSTNLAEECAQQGLDWREVLEQRALELNEMRRLGIPVAASHDNTGRPIEKTGEEAGETEEAPLGLEDEE